MGIHLMIYISSVSLFLLFYVLYHRAHRLAVKSTLTDFSYCLRHVFIKTFSGDEIRIIFFMGFSILLLV